MSWDIPEGQENKLTRLIQAFPNKHLTYYLLSVNH